MTDINIDFYSKPQQIGGYPVFRGARRQIGGSFLSGIARYAIPILKFLGRAALNIAGNTASDVLQGKQSLKDAAIEHGLNEIKQMTRKRKRGQSGRGRSAGINKRTKTDVMNIYKTQGLI